MLYRIRLKLCSPIVTPLKGDTIWGHIVWGIANHDGEAVVASFLEQAIEETPALIVSSAFPAGMVCRPLPAPQERTGTLTIELYSTIKVEKKIKYAPASEYFVDTPASTEEMKNPFKSVMVMHNTMDRVTNTVLENGLYSVEEKWSQIVDWDLYILSSLPSARIKELVEWAFENGYGADASTGKGMITIEGDPVPVKTKKQGNTYMALGPFVDANNGITNIRADIFIRSGKIGGAFAGSISPYKKPVVLFDEGAVFESGKIIEFTGKLLDNMHGASEYNICQSGFAPVIPV